ncbi:MAG: GNAT family N-acetyltransferase [Chitinophagaceae bacterium]
MTDQLTIRKATVDDVGIISHLAQVIWPPTYNEILSQAQIGYMMNLFYSAESLAGQFKKHHFILAVLNEQPVGFASYSTMDEACIYKLHKLYVRTDTQGKGLGKALIHYILDEISSLQAKALDLNVNRSNKARMFYEKLGFTVIREENIDIGQGFWMTDYVMRREV